MSSDNILVAIKSRPLISRETSAQLRPQWAVHEKTIFQIDEEGHRLTEPYSFDHIFTEYITNANVYDAVVEPLVKSFLNGFNSTIFAYGQTSSGKTHTMMGTHDIPGIIQLAIGDVFHQVSNDNLRRYLISCSYFEIYNEKINDLLDKNGKDLKIREDFCGNTFVNAKEEVVTKAAHVYDLMKIGSKIRKIGCTNMNERSSRSHTIFRLTIKSTENNIENGPVQISYLNLVDLAGSERIAHTKAAGVRLKEGVNINKSLLALGNVIRQLSEGEGFINYRDSNLTRLLQHALGGNAKSLIIATITIAAGEETKSTLEFAQRAKVVKNKPVINEISEQDKLKQYELVTASYKNRLEKEKQRIQEMEREKEEREHEILKLKRQVKLIDLFTNGPEVKTTESKIPRRHTMGHYPSRIPLQTIPESRVLPLNVIQEESVQNDAKCDLNDEESFLKRASQIDDYDYMKIILEETLDDGIVSVTPEPSEELLIQEETTPTSHLRERLKHLEESYTSLQEFTKLESQFKEDKGIVLDLVKEKENLLKDLVDMNIIVRDTKRQKEEMKAKFEAEINTLKNDLKYVKKKSDEVSFALEQSEAEKDALRVAKEQLLNDNAVLLEQQKLKYEDQIEYFIREIKELNKQGKEDQIAKNNFEEEIKRLRKENKDFKSTTEKMIIYEEKIMQLQEKLQKFESEEEEDFDILSVSTQTEEIIEEKEAVETELKYRINETIIQKECEELKEKMKKLNDKLEDMQSLNLALQDELCECKETNSSLLEMQIANSNLKHEIAQKQEKIGILCTMIQNLEKEVPLKDEQIMDLKSKLLEMEIANSNMKNDITQKQEEIDILFTKIQNVEKEGPFKDDQIINLKSKLLEMEMANSNMKNDISQKQDEIDILFTKIQNLEKEVPLKDDHIIDLKSKLLEMETANSNMRNDISQKQDEIDILFTKIQNLEKEVPIKDDHIIDLKSKLLEMETANSNMKNDISQKQDEIDILFTKIQNLEKEVPLKDEHIIDLKSKLLEMEMANSNMKKDITQKQEEIDILFDKIQNLEKEMPIKDDQIKNLKSKLLEMTNCETKNNITQKQEEIDILFTKIQNLEKEVILKDDQIIDLKSKLLEMTNSNKNDIALKQDEIDILFTKMQNIEKEVLLKDDQIIDLKSKLLEIDIAKSNMKNDIVIKQEEIDSLFSKIQSLEREISVKDLQIIDLKSKLLEIEIANSNMKDGIALKQEEIDILFMKIQNLETEIPCKDDRIIDLKSKLDAIQIEQSENVADLVLYKNEIELKVNEITVLQNKLNELEKENKNYKREIDIIKQQIMSKDKKIISLTEKCKVEASDKEALIQKIQHLEMKIKKGEEKNEELENKIKNIYSDNITLRANIVDLEDVITDLKSNTLTKTVEPRSTHHSSASSSSLDLSPKELRKRKRQSIHDQRRGIDLAATAVAICGDEKFDTTEDDLKQKIKKLEGKIEFLSSENEFLESEVQGFISELNDCRMLGDERRNEIKILKEQIEKMKGGQGKQDCNECRQKQHHIKKLEELTKQDMFKIVGLQTQIYDLENRYQEEKANIEERERRMNYEIKKLQTKLGERYEFKDAEIQCELTNIEQLIEKYSKVKKLARMRREEGNILRARLGMNPDEPIT